MEKASEQVIRDRAYAIWLAAGMEGDSERHWLDAERAVSSEVSMPVAGAEPSEPSKRAISSRTAPSAAPVPTKRASVVKASGAKATAKKTALKRIPKAAVGSVVAQA